MAIGPFSFPSKDVAVHLRQLPGGLYLLAEIGRSRRAGAGRLRRRKPAGDCGAVAAAEGAVMHGRSLDGLARMDGEEDRWG